MTEGTATPSETRNLGPKPRLEYHPPSALVTDDRYQRSLESKASQVLINRIAREFHWPYFGIIVATDNGDGTFCIIDGQHRAEAARRTPGVHSVPVMVLDELTLAEQAMAFVQINKNRLKLNALQIHRASVRAGEPAARELDEICARHGASFPPNLRAPADRKPGELFCVRTLARILKEDGPERLDQVIRVAMTAFEGDGADIRAGVVKAISLAIDAGATEAALVAKLRTLDGESWEDRARDRAASTGERSVVSLAHLLMRPERTRGAA